MTRYQIYSSFQPLDTRACSSVNSMRLGKGWAIQVVFMIVDTALKKVYSALDKYSHYRFYNKELYSGFVTIPRPDVLRSCVRVKFGVVVALVASTVRLRLGANFERPNFNWRFSR